MTNVEWIINNNIKFSDLQIATDIHRGIYLILVERSESNSIDLLYWNELGTDKDYTAKFLLGFINWLGQEVDDD